MYQIEVDNKINQIIEIFKRLGLWRNEDELTVLRKTGSKLFYLIFYVCYALSLVLGGLLSDDRNESVFLIAVGVATFVVTVKLAYILWKKEQICAFISNIGVHSIGNHDEFIRVNDKVKNIMKFSCGFVWLSVTAGLSLTIFYLPVFTDGKKLPLNVWFPLDWKNNAIFYWIAYAFVSFAIMISAVVVLLNVIIWYLMMNCAIKYQILGTQFRNIAPKKPTIKKRKITEEEKQKWFFNELIGLIKTHQNIKELIDRFKSCFSNLFFAQITTSGICICGSVYALAFGSYHENSFQFVVNIVFMLYNIFDIFMVMYLGNEIRLWSDRLSYCLFESNWIEQSKSCKKCIIILTEVLKQPHELVIGKLYPLTLETFTSILNLAYSMFNILQNLN